MIIACVTDSFVVSDVADGICKSTALVGPCSGFTNGVTLGWFESTGVNAFGVGLGRKQTIFIDKIGARGTSGDVTRAGERLGSLQAAVQGEFGTGNDRLNWVCFGKPSAATP